MPLLLATLRVENSGPGRRSGRLFRVDFPRPRDSKLWRRILFLRRGGVEIFVEEAGGVKAPDSRR